MDRESVVRDHPVFITARTDAVSLARRTDAGIIAQHTFTGSLAGDTSGHDNAGIIALWATAGPAFAGARRAFSSAATLRTGDPAFATAPRAHRCSTGCLYAHATAQARGTFNKFVPHALCANSAGRAGFAQAGLATCGKRLLAFTNRTLLFALAGRANALAAAG
ncbi:MAG: hypothetical protein NTV68_00035 [Methanomicrobiales archaeon]|nr:hypothetical protein [Methanomicrobiales archaeon]